MDTACLDRITIRENFFACSLVSFVPIPPRLLRQPAARLLCTSTCTAISLSASRAPKWPRGSRRFHSRGPRETVWRSRMRNCNRKRGRGSRRKHEIDIEIRGGLLHALRRGLQPRDRNPATRFFGHPRRPTGDASRPYRSGGHAAVLCSTRLESNAGSLAAFFAPSKRTASADGAGRHGQCRRQAGAGTGDG